MRGGQSLGVVIWEAVVEILALVPVASMLGQKGHVSFAMTPLALSLNHVSPS